MRPFMEGWVGNPAAPHTLGQEARESVEGARTKVGRLLGGRPEGVLFTSGATEANNLAIKGVARRGRGRHVVTTAVEHPSVLVPCRELERAGFAVTVLPVDGEGRVTPEQVRAALTRETCLVALGAANGELGTVQPWREIAAVARAAGVPVHLDAVGALGRLPLAAEADGVDLVALASNDLYGPTGAGALWVRPGLALAPQIVGGPQEGGLRAGTANLAGVVGLGVAAELAQRDGPAEAARLAGLRDRLLDGLAAREGIRLLGPRRDRLPQHAGFCVPGVKAEALLAGLDLAGVTAASGSACASASGEPSHVLRALGLDPREAEGAVCLTLGRWTTGEDVDVLLAEIGPLAARLRALSPLAPP
jgi:cysteine desulfurase